MDIVHYEMLLTGNVWVDAAGVFVSLVIVVFTYFKYAHTYWRKQNIQHIEPKFPFGTLNSPFGRKQPLTMDVAEVYKKVKAQGVKHTGIYMMHDPVYIPIDIEIVKSIMSRDFGHFVNHGTYYNEEDDPLSAHLFAIEDEKWKNLRAKLTPTFTSGKLKSMFGTFVDCSVPLSAAIDELHEKKEALDIKELVARFTTDIIGSCAFGIECNSFKHPDAEFRKFGKLVFEASIDITTFFVLIFPKLAKKFKVKINHSEVSNFFLNMIKNTVEFRESNNYRRNDFMQLLIELKNNGDQTKHDGNSLTLNELSAQAFVFFVAGFETSSVALTYCLYELSQNMEVQEKVRAEIERVLAKHNGEITYNAMHEMKYLEQCINETLRKYPSVPLLTRVCTQEYNVPNTNVLIEKGTKVFISSYGIQHDPEYYPDPEKFDPDRFSEENKHNINPYTFLPFGEGPRICIGLRFGVLQTKVGLVTVLRNHRLRLNPKTPSVLSFKPKSFFLTNAETIYLDAESI